MFILQQIALKVRKKIKLKAVSDFYAIFTCSFLPIDAKTALIGIINIITPTPANTDGPIAMYRNIMDNTIWSGADQMR